MVALFRRRAHDAARHVSRCSPVAAALFALVPALFGAGAGPAAAESGRPPSCADGGDGHDRGRGRDRLPRRGGGFGACHRRGGRRRAAARCGAEVRRNAERRLSQPVPPGRRPDPGRRYRLRQPGGPRGGRDHQDRAHDRPAGPALGRLGLQRLSDVQLSPVGAGRAEKGRFRRSADRQQTMRSTATPSAPTGRSTPSRRRA